MKTNQMTTGGSLVSTLLFSALTAWFVLSYLGSGKVLFIQSDRAALLTLFIIAMPFCGVGIGRVSSTHQWAHPLAILGYILGAIALLFTAAGLFGFSVAFVQDARTALVAVAGVMAIKVVINIVHSLI